MKRTFGLLGMTAVLLLPSTALAQLAVVDVASLRQTTTSALQNLAAVAKQVEQYNLQVQQYANQIKNTTAPLVNVYREAKGDVQSVQTSLSAIKDVIPTNSNVGQYLSQFTQGGMSGQTDTCGKLGLCSPDQLRAASAQSVANSQSRDAGIVQGAQQQLQSVASQATDLNSITQAAAGASGQLEAQGYTNQIGALNAGGTLQIVSLLTQQQQREAIDRLESARQSAIAAQSRRSADDAGQAALAAERSTYQNGGTGHYEDQTRGLPTTPPH